MSSKKDPEPTTEHQEAVAEQVQEQRGVNVGDAGPDPIIEAIAKLDPPEEVDESVRTGPINAAFEKEREQASDA